MRQTHAYTRLQRWSALIAGLFGIATIVAGGRVLLVWIGIAAALGRERARRHRAEGPGHR